MAIPLPFCNMIRELVVFLIKNLEVLIQLIHCPGLQRFSTESVGGMKEGVVERNLNMYDHIVKYPYKYMVYLLQCIQFGSAKKLYRSCISAIVLQQICNKGSKFGTFRQDRVNMFRKDCTSPVGLPKTE